MVKQFYNRYKELKFLKEKYDYLQKGEFGVIYGRRRMGKTVLLRKFSNKIKGKHLFISVTDANKKDFQETLSKKIENIFEETIQIRTWKDFFDYLAEKSANEKLLVIFDEFQRIYSFAKDFIYTLQDHWDKELKHNKIMIIICGSSMSMMHKIALEEKGPLYGRKTFTYHLKQFKYLDFREMFGALPEEEKIKLFAAFGGTPKYLEDFKVTNKNLFEAFEVLVLKETGSLYQEPLNALKFELKNPERYVSIISNISKGKVESKEIADALRLENYELSPYLRNLSRLLDIIDSNDPLFGKKRMMRYKIKDNFFRFWFRFVYPFQEQIEIGNLSPVLSKISRDFQTYCGKIFEDIVMEFFTHINGKKILNKDIYFESIGKWWEKGEDIDLVLKNKSETIFVECKFRDKKTDVNCFEDLKRKSKKTSASGKFYYIIISKSGFENKLIAKKLPNLMLIDLKQMTKIMDQESRKTAQYQESLKKYFDFN